MCGRRDAGEQSTRTDDSEQRRVGEDGPPLERAHAKPDAMDGTRRASEDKELDVVGGELAVLDKEAGRAREAS